MGQRATQQRQQCIQTSWASLLYWSSPKHSPWLLFGCRGRAWMALQLPERQSQRPDSSRSVGGAGMVGSLKATASPHPCALLQMPAMFNGIIIAPRNLPARRTAAHCCSQNTISGTTASLSPKPYITLQPESARFPEIPAMDEAVDFSHRPTQQHRTGKPKKKWRSYWWWSPKPYLSIQPGEPAVS